ncbi:MAG TPA: S-methyl-5-thioribose-1-phosphate isomerase [Actinomycetota bacterium]|nr:S-methyl-5-thioribose-1-phosphate isomerase [Actinomycetota bacterium]
MSMQAAVEWRDDHLEVIDQTLLPGRLEVLKLTSSSDVVDAIARMVVRGAPAIGVCGGFGVVLGLDEGIPLERLVVEIGSARPTGANLRWAVERVARAAQDGRDRALDEALTILREDREACERIGEFGRAELASMRRVLTHCNTGRLATTGIGTALGIVYAKAAAGDEIEVVATETRPALQGARLTAWELTQAGIPVTLISDTAAGAALASHRVDAVVVGVDRVARSGDFANKVGTYALAVLARTSGLPFYAAGPMTSFDPAAVTGAEIPIEERSSDEVRRVGSAAIAPEVAVWNPAFDITPAELVTAFITDLGVLRPPFSVSIGDALQNLDRGTELP